MGAFPQSDITTLHIKYMLSLLTPEEGRVINHSRVVVVCFVFMCVCFGILFFFQKNMQFLEFAFLTYSVLPALNSDDLNKLLFTIGFIASDNPGFTFKVRSL